MKRTNPVRALIYLVALGTLSGCATIFGGRSNSLVFESATPADAQVFVDDSLVGSAAGKIVLEKGIIQHGSVLEIKAEGYETQEYLILLKPHPGYVLADFAVGAVPLIVDYGTGNILRPEPRKFQVVLEETGSKD